jgi:putative NADPH-quinone reductase
LAPGLPDYHREERRMRVLILYANPSEKSFGAALHKKALETLRSRGHHIDDCDLYAEGFDPVMSRQEREHYHDPSRLWQRWDKAVRQLSGVGPRERTFALTP